jgi:hypothetical protein
MYNGKRSSFTADKDYFATDAGEVVGGEHPLRRKLVALQGQNVHEVYAKEYDLPRDYDDVPHPADPEPIVGELLSVDYDAIIAEKVGAALAEQAGSLDKIVAAAVAKALAAAEKAK